jgi:hypothetical protein
MPNFADRGCRVISAADPYDRIIDTLDLSRHFFFQVAPHLYLRDWTPFQTHYFSENMVVPGIESGPLNM